MKTKKIEVYRTLRNEILQYLQNYQNIRNTMYVVSLTMLGFFINEEVNTLCFLTPSVIITCALVWIVYELKIYSYIFSNKGSYYYLLSKSFSF